MGFNGSFFYTVFQRFWPRPTLNQHPDTQEEIMHLNVTTKVDGNQAEHSELRHRNGVQLDIQMPKNAT